MRIYLAIGLICLLSISAFSRVARRDDNGVPASIIQDANGNFVIITADGWMKVVSSTTLTGGIIDSILNPVTTYITASQVVDLKIVSLPDGTTVYLNESQLKSLKEDTTTFTKNFPTDYPDSTVYEQILSSVTTVEKKYLNKVSTGTSGKITATTSQQIVISNNVSRFQFTFVNSADSSLEAIVISSVDGDSMYFYDGFWKVIPVDIPQPITFDVTLPVTSTMTYEIQEVRQP